METDPFAAISVSCPKCGVGYVVRASPHYVRYGCDSEFEFGKLLQSAGCRAAELKAAVAQCEQLECCEVMKSDVSIRIADLEAEVARLRAALGKIERSGGRDGYTHSGDGHAQCRQIAAAALAGKE